MSNLEIIQVVEYEGSSFVHFSLTYPWIEGIIPSKKGVTYPGIFIILFIDIIYQQKDIQGLRLILVSMFSIKWLYMN